MNMKDIYDLYDNEFIKYSDNECYLFIYDHLDINYLAKLLNRDSISFLYQSGEILQYKIIFNKIFCQNGKYNIRASIYKKLYSCIRGHFDVNGIIVKITKNELEILKIYYTNYELSSDLINIISTEILLEDYIDFLGEKSSYVKYHPSIVPYVFIYEDDNNIREIPTKSYIKKINKMLHNREQINEHKKQYYEKFLKK